MISSIIMGVSLLLDGILSNFLPFMIGDLSLFTPMFSIVSLFLIYQFFIKDEKKYLISCFIFGIIYDLFYTNLLFLDGLLFLLLAFIVIKLYKNFSVNVFNLCLYIILLIVIYEIVFSSLILVFNLVPITFYKVLYKIGHSLILNIIYGYLVYGIIKLLPKSIRRVNIN